MIRTLQARADFSLDTSEFRRVLLELHGEGWPPVGLSAELLVADLAGLSSAQVAERTLRSDPDRFAAHVAPAADAFVRDRAILYATAGDPRRGSSQELEIGLISALPPEEGSTLLEGFADAIKSAVTRAMDGRRTRHFKFEWTPVAAGRSRLDRLCRTLEEDGAEVRFRVPELTEGAVTASQVLAHLENRNLLQEFSKAVFVREQDLLARRASKVDDIKATALILQEAGLVADEYLLQCRHASTPLVRLSSEQELEEMGADGLRCGTCGRNYGSELLLRGFSVSELGREMVDGSHWMTVWVTQRLVDLGVPADAILWNLEESSEEIDLVLELFGQLWIVELKDRNFQAGDAHPLNYRQVRYGAAQSLIVTTGTVGPDARRVFEDLANEARRRDRGFANPPRDAVPALPVFVEGLDAFDDVVGAQIAKAAEREAAIRLMPAAWSTGFELSRLIQAVS